MSANSTYDDARTFGILAATDLYGSGSAEVIAATNAFMQLELGPYSGPSDTGSTAPAGLTSSGTTSTSTKLDSCNRQCSGDGI
jgi:hypothetical protein